MNTKRKRKKNRIMPMACALGIFIGSVCNSYMKAYAEALPIFPPGVDLVSAADCIMSYMTSAGLYIANIDWINELYTSFGGGAGFYINDLYQNGLLTLDEAGHYVSTGLDTALESQSAWTSLHLDQLFNVTAQEAAVGGGVAATGAGTIAGAIGGVATTGALPLALGVTGAYWGGIGLGTLIAHATGLYGKQISAGVYIDTAQNILNSIPAGCSVVTMEHLYSGSNGRKDFDVGSVNVIYFKRNGTCYACTIDNSAGTDTYLWLNNNGSVSSRVNNVSKSSYRQIGSDSDNYFYIVPNSVSNDISLGDYVSGVKNGSIDYNKNGYSPDVITSDGNARANVGENGEITIPSMIPEVNPAGQSIVPGGASLQDWLRWANGVKGNNANNDPDSNADILQEILEAIRNNNPSPGINPNPNPNPNPTPTPTPVPKPDYDPSQPEQPEYDPKETEGPDNVTDGNPWTTPDLLDKFPFCLPRDVFRCFEKLDVNERMAPSISWHFTTPLGIHFDFDLDLDDYEGVAAILRTLELIAFIIGLALATRNLIGR